ncbi:MAG: tyrosine--tRNA ligase [Spirochaetaceae bacterium]|nr:MAG: tyrosine--tRNA ligase [Spirochaetaceae bacterium]
MNTTLATLKERGFFAQCSDEAALSRLMDEGPVSFYVGIDPTGDSLHIGHLVPLYAMVHLARDGHRPVALVGGGTARIGDPSGKTEARRILSVEQINANVAAIEMQIRAFLSTADVDARFVNNADWLAELNYIDFLRDIGRHFSVNRMLSFETYRMRLETGLSFIEFNYQLLQSYDFLELYRRHDVRLQIGGDDQWGNIVAGVDLTRRVVGADVYGLTFPLVTRADGKKMGKTEDGAVFLDPRRVSAYEMFQYWRNVPDADVGKFLLTYTFLPTDECKRLGSLPGERINEAKETLALEATALIHGREAATASLEAAKSAFAGSGGAGGADAIPSIEVPASELAAGINAVDLFHRTSLCSSRSDARRLIDQGGAWVNDRKVDDVDQTISTDWVVDGAMVLRAGKKRYFRVIVA